MGGVGRALGPFRRLSIGLALVAFTALILAACGGSGGTTSSSTTTTTPAKTASSEAPAEITPEQLVAAAEPTNEEFEEGAGANWPIVGGDLANSRYSSLEGINKENVGELHLVWQGSYSEKLNTKAFEEESSPIVNEGVMFMVTPEDNMVAVNAATGKKLWEWKAEVKESESRSLGVDGVQGMAVGDGMAYVQTYAGKLFGVDVETGKTV